MSEQQHSRPEEGAEKHVGTDRLVMVAVRIPESEKWALNTIASQRKTNRQQLLAGLIADLVAREGAAA